MTPSSLFASGVSTDGSYLLVRQVLRLLRRLRQALDEPLQAAMKLGTKEVLVRAAVMDGFDTTSTVAEYHRLPAPTVTRIVTKLANQGLLERVTDSTDLRKLRLRLTPEGESTRAHTRAVAQDIARAQLGHLPAKRVNAALLALKDLETALVPSGKENE
ncbi:MarR family winged helix-turn-helix transcriptional regulator [Deinococcus hopiensis]|uniref:DNA-binding transcriptional regulator, MarR family n=1 Tax=Deinococcus hopiensis KR-140 TaxID=695939 RepID=A0A1W1V9Y2_9DEIO|nr:MarR family winged helix-turn-helix transcriptional regulator [Deinococcus hopiensis]SMB90053.1 DNA-binding transcriptional regulator, MarR family [Deinococcus hopiensis KR-140]